MLLVRYGANYTYSVNFKMNPRLTHPTKKKWLTIEDLMFLVEHILSLK